MSLVEEYIVDCEYYLYIVDCEYLGFLLPKKIEQNMNEILRNFLIVGTTMF